MHNKILWFTGLSGSGKTTLANLLSLHVTKSIVLDGDELRSGLCSDLQFSVEDRNENIRRVRELALFLFNKGFSPIVSFISPMMEERKKAKEMFPEGDFIEIFLSTPLDVCESRDVKGLYKKHRETMTGIGSPYEAPEEADLVFDTSKISTTDCVLDILTFI